MSSALSITQAVNPPRAVFLDYPLGHTSGRPADKAEQFKIMQTTLRVFASATQPGDIVQLPFECSADHTWKDRVMRPHAGKNASESGMEDQDRHADDRIERYATPQYQLPEDEIAADEACPTCVFLSDNRSR